jgi:hypothetical protein
VFDGPCRVDQSRLVRKPTPAVWRDAIKDAEVSVLSLVKDPGKQYETGFISYHGPLLDSPEVEIICGGLNVKELEGAALWRQGHLFHFAFNLSPAEMNETGQALLLNSIAYISRFTEDRPIARTPNGWGPKDDEPRRKRRVARLFATRIPPDSDLDEYFTPATKAIVRKMNRPAYQEWYEENSPFLICDKTGKLLADSNAKALGIAFDQAGFFPKAIARLGDSASAARARELLKRYAPDGPATSSVTEWADWWETNRPYLFYSEAGSYRWYIDPLAKRRGIPSDKLRGPARATTMRSAE